MLTCFTLLKQSGKITADSFRKSFLEWEAVRFEVEKICREDYFVCPACTPDMLAVSVDGNRKHYRFKNAARYLRNVCNLQCCVCCVILKFNVYLSFI